jgi:hypothetical protein
MNSGSVNRQQRTKRRGKIAGFWPGSPANQIASLIPPRNKTDSDRVPQISEGKKKTSILFKIRHLLPLLYPVI